MDTLKLLNDKKIRPSGLRLKILEYIMTHRTHPTIDEIYEALLKDNPTLSKTTVYNTVKVLVEKGLIIQISIDGHQARFDSDISEHGHFICNECGKIYDFAIISAPKVDLSGFEISETQVYCSGVCKECSMDF